MATAIDRIRISKSPTARSARKIAYSGRDVSASSASESEEIFPHSGDPNPEIAYARKDPCVDLRPIPKNFRLRIS